MQYFKALTSQASNKKYFKLINQTTIEDLCTKQYRMTKAFMDKHLGKIGIIIERNQDHLDKSKAIIDGIKASLADINHKEEGSFVVKMVPLKKNKVNNILSNMILNDKVGLIITWGQDRFIEHIQRWQKGLDIPGIFISNQVSKHKNTFNIFPSRKNYAMELVKTLKEKNIKKLAILTPDYIVKTPLLKTIKNLLKQNEIEIVFDIQYTKDQFDTYDMACRSIFNIDRIKRKDELETIYLEEQLKAHAEGFELNTKHVFLPAEISYDAIFIPDDFKTVLHFTKLFKYYQAKEVPLIGTYQWRSQDLLRPNEEYLEGATFIDFLGDYDKLPIEVNKDKNDATSVGYRTDYKLMGYYTGLISQIALKNSKQNKSQVTRELSQIKLNDTFIQNKKAFTDNEFNWPSFAIEVKNNQFQIPDSY